MRPDLLLLLFAVGCGPTSEDGPACEPGDAPTLDIGDGVEAFNALEEGDTIELVYGAQGGHHIEIGLEATYIDADDLLAGTITGTIGGEVLATTAPWLDFRCNGGESLQSWGTRLVFDVPPEDVHDVDVVVDAEVTDVAGTVVTASKTMHIMDPTVR